MTDVEGHRDINRRLLSTSTASEVREPDRREKVYWVYCVVIFILNLAWVLFESGVLLHQLILRKERGYNIVPIVFTATGLLFLANGLFGRKKRGASLFVFLVVYQIVPAVALFIFLLFCIFGYKFAKDELKRAFDYVTESADVEGSTIMLWVLLLTTVLIVYHMTAGFAIDRYKQLRRQRNWYF